MLADALTQPRRIWLDVLRQNEDLEQVSVAMQEEKELLRQEAENLAQQLQAVLNDKFARRGTFDADTPIDKTLNYLQDVISVSAGPSMCLVLTAYTAALMQSRRSLQGAIAQHTSLTCSCTLLCQCTPFVHHGQHAWGLRTCYATLYTHSHLQECVFREGSWSSGHMFQVCWSLLAPQDHNV